MAFDSCLVVYFDSYGGYVCSYQHLSRRGNGPLVTLVSLRKKIWGAEVIHGKVQDIHASKGRYSIRVQMPDKELVQEFRGGVGTWCPSCPSRDPLNDDWAVEKQACRCFVLYTSSETKTKWWNLEIFPGFGCDSWPSLQEDLRWGRIQIISLGASMKLQALEIGSIMFGFQDLGEVWIYISPLMLRRGWK